MTHQVLIERLGSHGEGVARLDGLVLFVEGALPQELVEVRLLEKKRNYARAELVKLLKPSSARQKPPCPFFDRCGGCQLMHVSYAQQLEFKRQRVKEALERIGGLSDFSVDPCQASEKSLHYRNKVALPVAITPDGKRLGLYARGSHQIVPINRCLIHCELGEEVFTKLQGLIQHSAVELRHLFLRTAVATQESLVLLSTWHPVNEETRVLAKAILAAHSSIKGVVHQQNANAAQNTLLVGPFTMLAGQSTIQEELLGLKVSLSAPSFFQVNPWQAEVLYHYVGERIQQLGIQSIVDAYCGIGLFASYLAKNCVSRAKGIEVVPEAIDDARINATNNEVKNIEFLCGRVEELLQECLPAEALLLNPPRKGCDPAVLKTIIKKPPKQLFYTSCDPATLARDLKELVAAGFKLVSVRPFDMFPQTMHVETVAELTFSPS